MGWDPAADEAAIEGVQAAAWTVGTAGPGQPPGDRPRGRARIRRWLPMIAVGGPAAAIVVAGLLGPKAPAPVDAVRTVPAPPSAPVGPPATPPAAATPPATPVPQLRLAGRLPDDHFLLLAGRWVDLATGTAGAETGCELERPLVLVGGRIVCVSEQVNRSPASTRATYALTAVTLGRARPTPADPWASPPPPAGDSLPGAVPLLTLSGRRDLAFGDPVAISLAAGAEPDSLFLAWAALEEDGYRVGLEGFTIHDDGVAATGSRDVLRVPLEDARGPTSLAELAVSLAPDGRSALVGITVVGTPGVPAVRHLAVLRLDRGAAGRAAIGLPVALPDAVASNATGPADVVRDRGAACGGSLGEGWATDDLLFLLCPGRPSVFRRVAILPEAAPGVRPPAGPPASAAILDESAFVTADRADAAALAGNGVAIDRPRGRYYRWSPATHTLWSIDLAIVNGFHPVVAALTLEPVGPTRAGVPAEADASPAARPVLALDAATGRLYVLTPGDGGSRAGIEVVSGPDLVPRGGVAIPPEPFASLALGPDGRLLYVATPPRGIVGAGRPLVAVEVLDAQPLAERLFAGRLPPGGWDAAQPMVVR